MPSISRVTRFTLHALCRAMAATWILAVEVKKLVVEGHKVADLWTCMIFLPLKMLVFTAFSLASPIWMREVEFCLVKFKRMRLYEFFQTYPDVVYLLLKAKKRLQELFEKYDVSGDGVLSEEVRCRKCQLWSSQLYRC